MMSPSHCQQPTFIIVFSQRSQVKFISNDWKEIIVILDIERYKDLEVYPPNGLIVCFDNPSSSSDDIRDIQFSLFVSDTLLW